MPSCPRARHRSSRRRLDSIRSTPVRADQPRRPRASSRRDGGYECVARYGERPWRPVHRRPSYGGASARALAECMLIVLPPRRTRERRKPSWQEQRLAMVAGRPVVLLTGRDTTASAPSYAQDRPGADSASGRDGGSSSAVGESPARELALNHSERHTLMGGLVSSIAFAPRRWPCAPAARPRLRRPARGEDDDVLAHLNCSKPLAFECSQRPDRTVSLFCPQPRDVHSRRTCPTPHEIHAGRNTSPPASRRASRTSRYFFGTAPNVLGVGLAAAADEIAGLGGGRHDDRCRAAAGADA
jgi:hypothetical protein